MEIPNRLAVEDGFARRLGRLSRRHREELLSYLGTPPDVSRVPEAFWAKVREEQENEMLTVLLLIAAASADTHGADPDLARSIADDYATGQAATVAAGYVEVSRDVLADKARRWAETPPTVADVRDDIGTIFGPERDARIAVNETTEAQTRAGERTVQATVGTSPEDIWRITPPRVCQICKPLDGTPRSNWARFFPGGPPEPHVGCKCEIVYANLMATA